MPKCKWEGNSIGDLILIGKVSHPYKALPFVTTRLTNKTTKNTQMADAKIAFQRYGKGKVRVVRVDKESQYKHNVKEVSCNVC